MESSMTVNVRIPTPLRQFTEGSDVVAVEGGTVGDVLKHLGEQHPGLAQRLYDDNGKVRRFVNIFANDEDIRFLDDLDTPVADGDEVSLVPAIAGG